MIQILFNEVLINFKYKINIYRYHKQIQSDLKYKVI